MVGTVRTLDKGMQNVITQRMKELVPQIAEAYGGSAILEIKETAALTYNDPDLTAKAVPSLEKAIGAENVELMSAITGAEDFSAFQEKVPGFFFFWEVSRRVNPCRSPSHHTPEFVINDAGMIHGVKAMVQLTLDYLK